MIKKSHAAVTAALMSVACIGMLGGCSLQGLMPSMGGGTQGAETSTGGESSDDSSSGLNPLGILTGETDGLSSRNAKSQDRENYSTVQDTKGNEYVTVLYLEPTESKDFDVDAFSDLLNQNNIMWYQIIAGNSMGTGMQESAYLYFTQDITYTELENYAQILAKAGYNCSMLTPSDYQSYCKEAEASTNFYYNERVYYGPAAQQ